MKCMGCPLNYVQQTGRYFKTRYKEYIQAIRNNNSNLGYSKHILNTGHAYGSITNIMDIIKTDEDGRDLNTLERYHIYKISKGRLHMNDTYIDTHNPIFETLLNQISYLILIQIPVFFIAFVFSFSMLTWSEQKNVSVSQSIPVPLSFLDIPVMYKANTQSNADKISACFLPFRKGTILSIMDENSDYWYFCRSRVSNACSTRPREGASDGQCTRQTEQIPPIERIVK
jgi:hypothetical protein